MQDSTSYCTTDTGDNQNLTLLTLDLFAIRALEGLQVAGEEKDILKEIQCGMEAEDQEEVVVKAIKELKKSPAKSVRSSVRATCKVRGDRL